MTVKIRVVMVALAGLLLATDAIGQSDTEPLLRRVDLDVGQTRQVTLHDGSTASVRLLDVSVERDEVAGAIRAAQVTVEVNGARAVLGVGNYNLPTTVGGVQIDAPVVGIYRKDASVNFWAIEKDARLRLWPAGSPWIRPETFGYPIGQRLFATDTQFANEPSSQTPDGTFYYHAALDFGGAEGMDTVYATTGGVVAAVHGEITPAHREPLVAAYGRDVAEHANDIYVRDARGWYHRYVHLDTAFADVQSGETIELSQPLGLIGKRGSSGGWSHLHYEIKSQMPSGQWGTQNAYPFVWQAYQNERDPAVIAVARPHQVIRPSSAATLDGSHSWARGQIASYEWRFTDSTTATGPTAKRTYEEPGVYNEILKVTDEDGHVDYDFTRVEVVRPRWDAALNRGRPDWKVQRGLAAPGIHAAFHPSRNIEPGEEVTFLVRARGTTRGVDVWHFGDGSAPDTTKSNTDKEYHPGVNEGGYATVTHRFEEPGHYIVTVQRRNQFGEARTHLHVPVGVE